MRKKHKHGGMPTKMTPGKLTGPSHDQGGIILEAEGGEYIVKKESVDKLGKGTLDQWLKKAVALRKNILLDRQLKHMVAVVT